MAPPRGTGKLGLSLAGGGFRASLFHVGVLHRLAELDVLRRVEVLSTVSGGSITGALYALLLKKYLEEAKPRPRDDGGDPMVALTRAEYEQLVGDLERLLVRGVQKNLRTRLLMNPFGTLLVLLTGDSLGRRMARLYERYLLREIVDELNGLPPAPWWRPRWLWPGQMRMKDLVVEPGGRPITEGLAAYNARQRAAGGSAVTNLVINATSLNSGGRFYFSAVELGDWYLGYFRESEFPLLLARKALLDLDDDALRAVAGGGPPPQPGPRGATGEQAPTPERGYEWRAGEAEKAAALMLRRRTGAAASGDDPWARLFAVPAFPGQLENAAFGLLRPAKLAAWYLRIGGFRDPQVLGGRTVEEHTAQLWAALRTADSDVEAHLRAAVRRDPGMLDLLADYVLELYWLRSAERVSHKITSEWNDIRVGHAVGASACFPPVFPPFLVYGIYDDLHVPRLGLTDGGVYDNMGVTALLDEGCTEIIASDTSGLFNTTPVSASGQVGLAARLPDVLTHALGGVQRLELRERRRVSRALAELAAPEGDEPTPLQQRIAAFRAGRALDALVYFHINSPRVEPAEPDALPHTVAALPDVGVDALDVARLRTDLDGFGDIEVAALVNNGYDMADRYVRRYAPDLLDSAVDPVPPRAPRSFEGPNATPARAKLILEVGGARFFRALKLRTYVTWAFTLAAAAAILVLAWTRQLTVEKILSAGASLARAEVDFLDGVLGFIFRLATPASQAPVIVMAVLALLVLGLLSSVASRPRRELARRPGASLVRRLLTVRKWLRALSGNVLWGLVGLPAIVAGASAVLAWISYVFFHLPFMRASRIPREVGAVRRARLAERPAVAAETGPDRPRRPVPAGGE